MMPSSINSTREQNSSSVNNSPSIPSSVVSSETRPKRYSRTIFSFRDERMVLAAPTLECLTATFCNDRFLAHTFFDAGFQFLLAAHDAHAQRGLRHFQFCGDKLVKFDLFLFRFRKIIQQEISAVRGKLLQAFIQTVIGKTLL